MSDKDIKEMKEKTKKLTNKLQDLTKIKDDQKQINKTIQEIKKLKLDMERSFEHLKSYLEKMHIDKQDFLNADNQLQRALNQPSESNIQSAIKKMDEFINKLAA